MEKVAKALTAPKPDILFGAYLNRATVESDVYESQDPGIFSLDHRTMSALSAQEFSEIACGAVGEQFCFPTVAIERKSDSGSAYFAENQLLGSLCCIYESQRIAKRRFDENLPHLALGIVNVGNWVELWGCWPRNLPEKVSPHLLRVLIMCRQMYLYGTYMISTCSTFVGALNWCLFASTCTSG